MSTSLREIEQLIAGTEKYRLKSEITEGANGYAFRAHHLPLDQEVFLKILHADLSGDRFEEPRLLVEATKSDNGESNLVRVHDAQHLGNDYVLIAMEYVEGGSISSRLRAGPLSMMEAVCVAVGILHGVAQLHRSLLVHRDIKPANVILARRCGRLWPKLADFGSVARLAHMGASVTASRHSALYRPPEGWTTPGRYDVRSDLYQVGLVLFEMVHGLLPESDHVYLDREAKRELQELTSSCANSPHPADRQKVVDRALARAASGKGVVSFGRMQPYVPKNLARIINKAVSPDPNDRYQTPSEMIGDLEALRLPDWQLSPCGKQYAASKWSGCDWVVERDRKKPERWVVLRSREVAANFRRWGNAESARAACRMVTEAAP